MRWTELFADLEAQYDAALAVELAGEVADRTRREASLLSLADRLHAARGAAVRLAVLGAGAVAGQLTETGPDWLLLQERPGRQLLVPLSAVLGLVGAGATSEVPGSAGAVGRRLDLRWVLRGLAAGRTGVQVVLIDGAVTAGTLDRVGADHLDLAEHPAAEARRSGAVRAVQLIPLSAVAAVRSTD